MSRYEDPMRALDPFCGTATTALSAAYHGHGSVTTEINPFLVWLGQAKHAGAAVGVHPRFWLSTWSTAQIGVEPTGLVPYFWNTLRMVVPAVAISTIMGALNGYVLTKWRFRGDTVLFGCLLFACFIPFQIVLIPMASVLGFLNLAGTTTGLVLVHVVYGLGFTTLFFRNYYAAFPTELVKAAQIDGAGFFRIFWRILLPSSGPIVVVTVIWQFTNVWNDFLFGVSFADYDSMPMTVALNNLVSSSTGVKEYNVHFAGAILAALPTLVVYVVSGRYFVRGLMAGAVKG